MNSIEEKKVCKTCKQEKPLSLFRKGCVRYYQCKSCWNFYIRNYAVNPKSREKHLQAQRDAQKRYSKKYPEKEVAHRRARTNKAKLKGGVCELCGIGEDLHMHHPDYNRPLIIITMCDGCHRSHHA